MSRIRKIEFILWKRQGSVVRKQDSGFSTVVKIHENCHKTTDMMLTVAATITKKSLILPIIQRTILKSLKKSLSDV